jgi:hypothetical protein
MLVLPAYYNSEIEAYTFIKDSDIDMEIANSVNLFISSCLQESDTMLRIESTDQVKHYSIFTEEQLTQIYGIEKAYHIINNRGDSTVHRSRIISQDPSYVYENNSINVSSVFPNYTYTFSQYPLPTDIYLGATVEYTLNRTYAIAPDIPSEYDILLPAEIPKVDRRISNIIIDDAIRREEICSISLEPIRKETAACISPCYHCFDRISIEQWLTHSDKCPQCRIKCII